MVNENKSYRSYGVSKHFSKILNVFNQSEAAVKYITSYKETHLLNRERDIAMKILRAYNEPHRIYHNWEHIEKMLDSAAIQGILTDDLLLAILFHDIYYDPKSVDNEEKSALIFKENFSNLEWNDSYQAILDTKTHTPTNKISEQLIKLDLEILNGSLIDFIEFEEKIFKEYQFVDYGIYKPQRIEILTQLGVKKEYIDYVRTRKPRIAIYAGSFNPFHKGHLNILEKAEMIFDKVIVARGKNPDKKSTEILPLPRSIQYREVVEYDGLLTDLISEYEDDCGNITLVRGLRNGNDLSYEVDQYRYMQDLKFDIQVCSIFCDREFEHISSSAIRSLGKFGKGSDYIVK